MTIYPPQKPTENETTLAMASSKKLASYLSKNQFRRINLLLKGTEINPNKTRD